MNKVFINKVVEILENERKTIINRSKNNENMEIDCDGDQVDEIQAKIIALATAQLAARDKERLFKIDNTFKKIHEGTFGECEECGEDIAEKRLLFNPIFITCIGCAEHLEMLQRRTRA